ncbi:MAG TPA: membrane protein insertion efficiency factor YidD [Vicinamibacteria bacterium]
MSSRNASVGSGGPGRPARALLLLVEAYRVALSPLLGGHCRFWPSCSAFAEEAIRKHGAWRGARLAARRVLRCHPFHRGGVDPVP